MIAQLHLQCSIIKNVELGVKGVGVFHVVGLWTIQIALLNLQFLFGKRRSEILALSWGC